MPMIDALWDFNHAGASAGTRKAGVELRAWLQDDVTELAQFLTGRRDTVPAKPEIAALETAILRYFKPLRRAAKVLQAFSFVINRGNELGHFSLCPPRIPVLIARDKSPFLPGTLPKLALARSYRQLISDSLRDTQMLSETGQIGRILVSAAVNGGLLHPSTLNALHTHLTKPITVLQSHAYIDLLLPWQGQSDMELRRWFPDPLTELLLLNMPSAMPEEAAPTMAREQTTRNTWRCMKTFMKEAGLSNQTGIKEFLNVVILELKTELPIFLVEYARRGFVSHSTKHYVWKRINGCWEDPSLETETECAVEGSQVLPSADPAINTFDTAWLKEIRDALRGNNKRDAMLRVEPLIHKYTVQSGWLPPLIAGWAAFLLKRGSAAGNPLALTTLRDYVSQIGARITGLSAFEDFASLSVQGLEELYQQILEGAASAHHRRNLARGLREFHHYLIENYHADPIDVREVLGIGSALTAVDANIITIDEYKQILDCIDKSDLDVSHPDLQTLTKLIIILAFRCGLRRMEVLMLALDDIHDARPAEILIRPYEYRRLKTKSATRKLPIYALLEQDELDLLTRWLAKRHAQEERDPGSPFVFAIRDKGQYVIHQDTIFPIIHAVMRAVTGDGSVRFHHLRHSFATWTLMRLVLADTRTQTSLFQDLPETSALLARSTEFRNALYQQGWPTRKHVFAVASLLGHSGPDISLGHYIHSCDILLGALLSTRSGMCDNPTLVSAAPFSPASAYRYLHSGQITALIRAARAWRPERIVQLSPSAYRTIPMKLSTYALDESAVALFERLWAYLYRRSARHTDSSALGRRFGFSPTQTEQFEARAEYLRDLKVTRGTQGWRHRMQEELIIGNTSNTPIRLICPRRPHLSADQAVLARLAPPLLKLMEVDPAPTSSVLPYFVETAWQTRNELIFRDPSAPEMAIAYLQFLKSIGIKDREIHFYRYDSSARSLTFAKWQRALGLSWRHKAQKLTPPNKHAGQFEKWLGIKVVFSNDGTEDSGSYGYRYLLMMAYIYDCSTSMSKLPLRRMLYT